MGETKIEVFWRTSQGQYHQVGGPYTDLEKADQRAQIFAHETILVGGERQHAHPGMVLLCFWTGNEHFDRPLYRVKVGIKKTGHRVRRSPLAAIETTQP